MVSQNASRTAKHSVPRAGLIPAMLFAIGLALNGCASDPPAQVAAPSPVVSIQTRTLSPAQIAQVMGDQSNQSYRLGPDDVIAVNIYGHPDLSVPDPTLSSAVPGVLITSDGSVQLPLIGPVMVGGDSVNEAQSAIATAYGRYVTNPQVSVQLTQARSFRYYILGQFSSPGVKYPGHAMTLLPALALGGTVDLNSADLYQAYVAQGNVKLPVDLHSLLVEGDMSQNITLASGDTIVVPSSAAESAFVLGAVGKPGQVQFVGGSLSLLQALSDAGMGLGNITQARFSDVHIIRAGGTSAQLIVVNARATLHGQAADFPLQPGDIVYVPPTAFASWNQAIDQVLPSLDAVSALLNPFVSIAYLSRRN